MSGTTDDDAANSNRKAVKNENKKKERQKERVCSAHHLAEVCHKWKQARGDWMPTWQLSTKRYGVTSLQVMARREQHQPCIYCLSYSAVTLTHSVI